MISNHHPFAGLEFWIRRAGGIGDNELFDSGFGKNTNDRRHVARGMAFVKMHPPLSENDFCFFDRTENEPADMTGNNWLRNFGELGIRNDLILLWIDNE